MSAEKYKSKILRFIEGLNKFDPDAYDEFHAADCVFHSPPPWPDTIGLQQQKQFMTAFWAAYPDAVFTAEEILIDGDAIVTRWRYEATHSGTTPARRIAPTGKKVVMWGCSVSHVKDDKIVEDWSYSDQSALLEQLGVLPAV